MNAANDSDSPLHETADADVSAAPAPTVTVDLCIFGVNFQVRCAETDAEALNEVASNLDERMRRIRDTGNVSAMERLAVMAALNIGHENLQLRRDAERSRRVLDKLVERVDGALERHAAAPSRDPHQDA